MLFSDAEGPPLVAQLVKNLPAMKETPVIPGSGLIRQLFTWRKDRLLIPVFLGFPCGSDSKESACNMGDLGLILALGRSPGEGKGYPFQDSWVSLVAQTVKNLPAIQETWVQSLGQEDSPGNGNSLQ